MNKIKTVYLDLDGVLVNFLGGLHRALGVPYDGDNYPYEKGKWNMLTDIKGFDDIPATFEQCNDACTENFWALLDWMPDGHNIFRAVTQKFDIKNVILLTTCMPNPGTAPGKMRWIQQFLPMFKDRFIILGSRVSKGAFAESDTLLIDDRDKNIDEFRAAGGRGLLVPRPWNRLHPYSEFALEDVTNFLEDLG